MKKVEMDFRGIIKKISKIKRIYKILFSFLLNVLIFALLFYFIIMPQMEKKKQLEDKYKKTRIELDKLIEINNNMPKMRQEYAMLQETLQQMLGQLPETKDIPNLLRNVSGIGSETRLKITYFEPKGLVNKEFYSELPFTIKFTGSYHNAAYFFDSIRKLERIINISSFNLTTGPKAVPGSILLSGDCVATTYVYVKEQAKKEPPKQTKQGKK